MFGGICSAVTRYFFLSYLPFYLAVGHTLAPKIKQKLKLWVAVFLSILLLESASNFIILNSDTWWNKYTGCHNPAIASS
ncbi:MAG: hypothetical protein NZ901_02285 [Geminocystis sp.]|nr:hypothetical protein [Geminocystis sp.]HIK37896.1 hypothetical protein [Geminocystis sp. M7585_C2015_104]MCS7146998.1 hypothetical protein [Geminocystis sp.]MCX8077310.1 hypothetical protein [Geminocystis sp.]MDW8115822.1 hypothetical protein [Geminocystis sp.]